MGGSGGTEGGGMEGRVGNRCLGVVRQKMFRLCQTDTKTLFIEPWQEKLKAIFRCALALTVTFSP